MIDDMIVSFCQMCIFFLMLVVGSGVVWFGWLRWEFKKLDAGEGDEE